MRSSLNKLLFIIFFTLSFSLIANTDIPELTGPVVDQANVLSSQGKSKIEAFIRRVYKKHGVQLQVLIINTLNRESIEGYSMRVVEKWQLGSAKEDNGALFLLVINDRKMRIEVGQGLEGSLTDARAGRILDDLKPFLRSQNYDDATLFAIESMANITHDENVSIVVNNSPKVYVAPDAKADLIHFAKVFIAIGFTSVVFMSGWMLGRSLRS